MTITPEDIARLTTDLRETARLLEDHPGALDVMGGWTPGPKSPALQPSSGWVYEQCTDSHCIECPNPDSTDKRDRLHHHPKTADATGEEAAALADGDNVQLSEATDARSRFLAALVELSQLSKVARTLIKIAHPQATGLKRVVEETPEQIAVAGWCISCWRDGKRHTPIATRRNGTGIYAEFCRWCGDFRGEHLAVLGAQGLPPLELVKVHNDGRKVTAQMVAKSLARHEAETKGKTSKKNRKKSR